MIQTDPENEAVDPIESDDEIACESEGGIRRRILHATAVLPSLFTLKKRRVRPNLLTTWRWQTGFIPRKLATLI